MVQALPYSSGAGPSFTLLLVTKNLPKALREAGFDLENVSFFLSRRALQASRQSGLPLWQDNIFIPLARSASDASDHFCIPEDRAVEVGARITI